MDTEPLDPFDIRVESGQFAAREALSQFLEALQPLKLDVEEQGTIEMVLAEVLNNIVEHAYPPDEPSGPITIHCSHQSNGLAISITDRGNAMPGEQLPLGELTSLDVELENMPEGGFGWFLINNLARDVHYTRTGAENCTKMRLAVGMID